MKDAGVMALLFLAQIYLKILFFDDDVLLTNICCSDKGVILAAALGTFFGKWAKSRDKLRSKLQIEVIE